MNYYAQQIDDTEGLEKIEKLQSNDNNEIYEKATKILDTYRLEDEDEETQQPLGRNQVTIPSMGFNFS